MSRGDAAGHFGSNDPFEKGEIDEFYFFDNSEPNSTDSKPYVGI